MKPLLCLMIGVLPAAPSVAETVLVDNGQPRAAIVISQSPPRTVRLAAQEFQDGIERITGAHLPIVTQPARPPTVSVCVGRSEHTDRLGVFAEGLKDGAYRIVSGDSRVVLIGCDTEFAPIEPWARNNGQIVSGKLQGEWDRITGATWGVPQATLYKKRFLLPGETGLPDRQRKAGRKLPPLAMWSLDERGTFNAVCGLLRKLGVRWYAPGELGEVLPALRTISLPRMDETHRPDFPMRRVNVHFTGPWQDVGRWAMRLGMRDPYGIQVAHGMATMTHRAAILACYPDWFALYGGKRDNQPGKRLNQLCYSSEELCRQTVRWVRAQFDHYRLDAVSVMPPDAFIAICQCPLCAGKATPERGRRGLLSDYVWDFVNRVAREVRKTHPDRKVLCCAYGTYALPPLKTGKLEPNVIVSIVGGRRPLNNRPEQQEAVRKLRESWLAKTDNRIIVFENYPFTDRGWYLPSFTPHSMGVSINATKGISQGEDVWLSVRSDFGTVGIALNHFLVYFTQRMYWGSKSQDVDAMFREYCRLFYGPAEREMLAFLSYCEANWQDMEKDKARADAALALFDRAKSKADAAGVYGRRLAWMDDYLEGLRSKSRLLGQKRGPVPVLRLTGSPRGPIAIDGKLDDKAWAQCGTSSAGRLRELETGCRPVFGTSFKAAWIGENLYFGIRCNDQTGEKPNVATAKNDDFALWYGDCVEVLLETDSRSYYQIAVGPSGAVADLDRSAAREAWPGWDSKADVATHVTDGYWTVEMRIPVTQDDSDPLHQVIGRKPTQSLPWHINVCRQRIRPDGREYSAFSPTGTESFHDALKFAWFYEGRSHHFDACEPKEGFLKAVGTAAALARAGKRAEAVAAYQAAAGGRVSDRQKSYALEQAAAAARGLRDVALADRLAAGIAIDAVRKTVLMENLLAGSQAAGLVERFAGEAIGAWPFWARGGGYFARGRACAATKACKDAEADLARALRWTSDPNTRDRVRLALGRNREVNLKDDAAALAAYDTILAVKRPLGNYVQFSAVHAVARIHMKRGRFDKALAVLEKIDVERLRGYWHDATLLARGDVLRAAGRPDQALAVYKSVLAGSSGDARLRTAAKEKIEALGGG